MLKDAMGSGLHYANKLMLLSDFNNMLVLISETEMYGNKCQPWHPNTQNELQSQK